MSEGWPLVKLEDVLNGKPRNGVSPATGGTVEEKVLTLSSITGANFDANAVKIGRFKVSPPKAQRVSSSDLLICRGNGNVKLVGRGYIPSEDRADLVFPDTVIAAPVERTCIYPRFLEYVWNSQNVRDQIERCARTTNGTYKVNQEILKNITFSLPPMREQQRIAEVLGMVDALRVKRRAAIALLDDLAQSIFLDMFGNPATNANGWPVRTIGDLVDSATYGTSQKAATTGDVPVLRMGNITARGRIDLSELKYMQRAEVEDRHLVRPGDVLFNRTNSADLVGKTAVYRSGPPIAYAGYLIRVRVSSNNHPEYLSAFLNSRYGKRVLRNMCKSIVGMANINARELQSMRISEPPKDLQFEFARQVEAIERMRETQLSHLGELDDLFGSLEHRAFRGELWDA